MSRRVLTLVLVIAAIAGAAFFYWRLQSRNSVTTSLLVSGNIEAHESLVSFKDVQSRIVELPFDEGEWVEKGTVLARVDDSNYRQQVAIDETSVLVARNQLAGAQENLDAARQNVANDRADLAQKELDAKRAETLFAAEATSAESRDLSLTALKKARAALLHDAAIVRVAEQNIRTADATLRNAQEKLRLARITLGYTVLNAPFSGVILVRQSELGEVMQPGTPVVTLADLNHVWLRAYVSETDLGRIRWGQPATVTTDTYAGKQYHGHISFIASTAEFTPKSVETHTERVTLVYRIKIDIDNPRHELKPGMPADAVIQLNSVGDGRPANGPALQRD
jgi:HlyD family secretion protein